MNISVYAIPGMFNSGTENLIEDSVFSNVCKNMNMSPFEVKSRDKKRDRKYVIARQITMVILKLKHGFSLTKTANYFSKDHATVIHAIKTVRNLLDTDKNFKTDFGHLLKDIQFPVYK